MRDLPLNTLAALENAPRDGLKIRYFAYAWPKNRDTGETEEIGFWTGWAPITANVNNPQSGGTSNRVYSGAGQMLTIPSIPATLATEVRKVRFRLSSLSPEAANLFRLYNPRFCKIEIHRGLFDVATGQLVDPAECIFQGYITDAPIQTPKAGGEAYVDVECSSRSRILERTSGMLFSLETLKKRMGDVFGKYLDVAGAWRIWWGQEETWIKNKDGKPHEKFLR